MAFSSWRGTVGIVRPTLRTGGFEDLVRLLPVGIGVIPLILNVRRGAIDEFKSAIVGYEEKVAELAAAGVDVINPSGAPPFMVLGHKEERALIRKWQNKYSTRIFTSGTSHIDALRALKVRRFIGATYFRGDINRIYAKYFADAGFECLTMAGMDVDFDKAQELSSHHVYRFIKREFLAHRGAEAIYMLGPGFRTLDIIDMLEQDLGVPVVHAIPTQCWDIQRHLHVRQAIKGFGQLLAEMPDGPTMSVSESISKRPLRGRRVGRKSRS
jgi:maleate isomerase